MNAAMLLGAGLGMRLRPLTNLRPKPLVPVGERPLLDWHLEALEALGVESATINVSHLGEQIERHARSRPEGRLSLRVIREAAPTGTGGGLLSARELLEGEDNFLVVNADIFHAIDLGKAIDAHREEEADATLVLRRAGPGEPRDDLSIDGDGLVTGIGPGGRASREWRFTGIHVLGGSVFGHLNAPGSLADAYGGLLASGARVLAHDCGDASWFDVGTPLGYLEANLAAISRSPSVVAESARLGPGCEVGPRVVIGAEARIGAGSRISEAVVWPGATVSPGATVRRAIVYPGGVMAVGELCGRLHSQR